MPDCTMAPPRRSVGPTCSFFSRPVLESQLRKPRSYIEAFRERGRPRNPKDSGAGAEDRLSAANQGRETFYTFLWTLQKPNAISRVFWATRKCIFFWREKNLESAKLDAGSRLRARYQRGGKMLLRRNWNRRDSSDALYFSKKKKKWTQCVCQSGHFGFFFP